MHKQRDVESKSLSENKQELRQHLKQIYSSESKSEAIKLKFKFDQNWKIKEPAAVRSLNFHFEKTLTFLDMDVGIQRRIRTDNPVERYIEEIRRHTKPMRYF